VWGKDYLRQNAGPSSIDRVESSVRVGMKARGRDAYLVYFGRSLACLVSFTMVAGCSTHVVPAPPVVVAPASPPKDDGKASQQLGGGVEHSAALEQLKTAPLLTVVDKQRSVRLALPDARHWTRVKFFGIPTLVGFRYGSEHHAVVAVMVQHVDPDAPLSACSVALEAWGAPMLDTFDVNVDRDPTVAFDWRHEQAELHASYAKTASLFVHDGFAVAYATYPAWKGACLVVGIAVPSREDEARARAVRDRFAKEVLPKVMVLAKEEPLGRE
jgi:hypothetical protein